MCYGFRVWDFRIRVLVMGSGFRVKSFITNIDMKILLYLGRFNSSSKVGNAIQKRGTPSQRAWQVSCLDVVSEFCSANGKGPSGGAQHEVSEKFTTQHSSLCFHNSTDFHFKKESLECCVALSFQAKCFWSAV